MRGTYVAVSDLQLPSVRDVSQLTLMVIDSFGQLHGSVVGVDGQVNDLAEIYPNENF